MGMEEEGYPEGEHSGLWQKQEEPDDSSESYEKLDEKMMIFTQTVTPIFQKRLFFAFQRLFKAAPHNPKSTYECESIPLISRPNINEPSQEDYPPLP